MTKVTRFFQLLLVPLAFLNVKSIANIFSRNKSLENALQVRSLLLSFQQGMYSDISANLMGCYCCGKQKIQVVMPRDTTYIFIRLFFLYFSNSHLSYSHECLHSSKAPSSFHPPPLSQVVDYIIVTTGQKASSHLVSLR